MQNRHSSKSQRWSFKIKAALVAAVAAAGAGQALALDVGPYFQGYTTASLMDAKQKAGLDNTTLAFAITRGTCAFDPYLTDRMAEARQYVAAGGKLAISMGGADGVYAEVSCSDDGLFNLVEKLILESKAQRIDWDVEGHQLYDTNATDRRNRVLLRLQAKYPAIQTSLTLPGWITGLQGNSQRLMAATIAAGVRVDMVNLMAMSFGANNIRDYVRPSTLSQAVIMTYNAAEKQLQSWYPSKTPVQINAMMGITPMIGVNDDGTTFTLDDARIVADFAKSKGTGLLSYWAFGRDRAQATAGIKPLDQYSGVAQSDYQFLTIFRTAQTKVVPTPAPAPAPAPTPTPKLTPGSCDGWVANRWYVPGVKVTRSSRVYVATQANENSPPEWTPSHWALSTCTVATPAPAPAPVTHPAWVMYQQYPAGAIVTYEGKLYRAKYANPGYNPTVSTYFWAPYSG